MEARTEARDAAIRAAAKGNARAMTRFENLARELADRSLAIGHPGNIDALDRSAANRFRSFAATIEA